MTDHPRVAGTRRSSHLLIVGIGAVVAASIAFSVPSGAIAPNTSKTSASTSAVVDDRRTLEQELAALRSAVTDAETMLAGSDGRVADETSREELAASLRDAEQRIGEAQELLVWPTVRWKAGGTADTREELGSRTADVAGAVERWEAEQERIAAERAAAEVAARAAAAAARPASSGARAAAPAGNPVESMWTSGGQAEIDACRGSVNMPQIAAYLGGGFYAAEHWGCGGSAWGGRGAGAVVDFPGHGSYRVAGIVSGLAYGANASAIPAGYAGYYQTCIGGSSSNMAVWLLERV